MKFDTDTKFVTLLNNPPKLSVIENPNEVVLKLVSCMCDNKKLLTLKKNSDGDFKLSGNRDALSNFQFKVIPYEIEWAADEQNWDRVFKLINEGSILISEIKSR